MLSLNTLSSQIHADNVAAGWWTPPRPTAVTLMLIVSEISEAAEGFGPPMKKDDKLTDRWMVEVELGDAAIRILDLCGALDMDLEATIADILNGEKRYRSPLPAHRALLEIVNEVSRAMEGDRKSNQAVVEYRLAAALQRIIELSGDLRLRLWDAVAEKRAFNRMRADHQLKNRQAAGGKRY